MPIILLLLAARAQGAPFRLHSVSRGDGGLGAGGEILLGAGGGEGPAVLREGRPVTVLPERDTCQRAIGGELREGA